MTIRIFLGNVGSGKTACAVREIMNSRQMYFSNIITKEVKNNSLIDSSMIIKTIDVLNLKTNKYKEKLMVNKEYWEEQVKLFAPINVIVDEAHAILNARRGMAKKSQVFLEWMAMIRRVLGSVDATGSLTLISQLERRLDIIAKEMCNEVRYFICKYQKMCSECGHIWSECNEQPELKHECGICGSLQIKKFNHIIECWHFQGMDEFIKWKYLGLKKQFYRHYNILDIEKYFPYYNTLQWENLLGGE